MQITVSLGTRCTTSQNHLASIQNLKVESPNMRIPYYDQCTDNRCAIRFVSTSIKDGNKMEFRAAIAQSSTKNGIRPTNTISASMIFFL